MLLKMEKKVIQKAVMSRMIITKMERQMIILLKDDPIQMNEN